MSQFIVDDHLAVSEVLDPLRKRYKAQRLQALRPDELILDDRVPALLRTLDRPTFLTIDRGFWNRTLCHDGYGIMFFDVPAARQGRIPDMLRALLRKPEFATRATRMGRVVRAHVDGIEFWTVSKPGLSEIEW